ncbi:MAG: hypothetical protein QOG91_95 [Candidatus Parcubacteria bacterium]|jgi:hypothetical protein|nr:hypothetical protein [Candidatus Parcubacteria bacterium]
MPTYLAALIILAIVLVAQVQSVHGMYASSPFFDIVMHVLGGIGIGLFMLALIDSGVIRPRNKSRAIIAGALAAGIVWEIIEAYFDINGYKLWTSAYFLDTAKDLVNDLIGGTLIGWLSRHRSVLNPDGDS